MLAQHLPRHHTSQGWPPHSNEVSNDHKPLCFSRTHCHGQWPGGARSRKGSGVVGTKWLRWLTMSGRCARLSHTVSNLTVLTVPVRTNGTACDVQLPFMELAPGLPTRDVPAVRSTLSFGWLLSNRISNSLFYSLYLNPVYPLATVVVRN